MTAYIGYVLIGLVAGFASSMLGIGGGVIVVPALIVFFSTSAKAATATALAYIAPVALYGALAHWLKGHSVSWAIVLFGVPAGLIGAQLGLVTKEHLSEAQLKFIFGLLMLVIGFRLVAAPWMGKGAPASVPPAEPPAAQASE